MLYVDIQYIYVACDLLKIIVNKNDAMLRILM